MLTDLHIENFALIDRLDLQFQPGLNVLTGETGAGKSIVLDAIDAVMGGRANQRLIRTGAKKALVEATFIMTPKIARWLESEATDVDRTQSTLVCARELTAGKGTVRSRSRLNGVLVNKPQVESLRALLVEITAQGQTLLVGSPDRQREWLDGYGGEPLMQQRGRVATAYAAATQARKKLEQRRKAEQERLQQLDLFEYQCRELNGADLTHPDELDNLKQEQQRLSHSVELQQNSYQLYQILYENDGSADACADLLGKAGMLLADMVRYDPELEAIAEMVNDALAQVEEAGRHINAYGENLETDPERLEEVEQRIRQLKELSRKYEGRTIGELIEYRDEIQGYLDAMNGDGQSLEALEAAYVVCQQELAAACGELTQLRQQAAQALEKELVAELKPLAMERVQFQVEMQATEPTASGADRIQFLFSPNPGEPLQPLAETASGGEMSRFLLALKACFSRIDPVGTMVFDEIDVGVSGRVAQAIAEKLYQLGRHHQVLCVTHQPIVAAMADRHYRVGKQVIDESGSKSTSKGKGKGRSGKSRQGDQESATSTEEEIRTVVRIMPLEDSERREELAQLAGGESHQESLTFADALLNQAATIRQRA